MSEMTMTRSELRNWYAGMAINKVIFKYGLAELKIAASDCFDIAEAMVKESERREEKGKRSETNNE